MTLLFVRHGDAKLNQAHTSELIRRYGTLTDISFGWGMTKSSITSRNYATGEILTPYRNGLGNIRHRAEDY
jgi:hypothetical protein